MKKIQSGFIGLLFLLGLFSQASFATVVSSVTVTSNDPDCRGNPIARVFSVTAATVNKCLLKGAGNINGGAGSGQDAGFISSGWIFIDKTDDMSGAHDGWLTGVGGGTSGSFFIDALAYAAYDKIAIGFKSGNGQIDPDWAIFELARHTSGGAWSISDYVYPTYAKGNDSVQGLSHAILYGFGKPDSGGGGSGGNVPEPASLALIGLGLFGLARARRRRA